MKNNLISTPKILLITSLIILSTIGLTLLVQKYIPKIKTTLTREVSKQSLKNNEPEVLESPKYLLEVTKKAEYILGPCFSMAVKINNISVEPFITDVGFDNCEFVDSSGSKYTSSLDISSHLSKGLLPGETSQFLFESSSTCGRSITSGTGKSISLSPSTAGVSRLPEDCEYDKEGNNICKPIKGLKILRCDALIATDGQGTTSRDSSIFEPSSVSFPQ